MFALVALAEPDSMNKVVNRLLDVGYTSEQITVMKKYPVWPCYDLQTGLLFPLNGIQRHISTDRRLVVLYHVKTAGLVQTVTKEVLYDLTPKK